MLAHHTKRHVTHGSLMRLKSPQKLHPSTVDICPVVPAVSRLCDIWSFDTIKVMKTSQNLVSVACVKQNFYHVLYLLPILWAALVQ